MNAPSESSLFQTWPLVAIAICAVGLVLRALVMRDGVHAARLAHHHARVVFSGGRLMTASLVLLLAGHLIGLLFPRAVLGWNSSSGRLYLLEGVAFVVGLGALAAWARATWRHLRRTDAPFIVEIADSVFLAMMFVAIASGLGTAAVHRWGSSWGIATMRPWALSLLAGAPQSALIDHLPFLARVHVFSTFVAVAAFPLTRLAPLPILFVGRAAAVCTRPVVSVSRTGGGALWKRCTELLGNEPQYRWRVKPAPAAAEAALAAAGKRARSLPSHIAGAMVGERAVFSAPGESAARKAGT